MLRQDRVSLYFRYTFIFLFYSIENKTSQEDAVLVFFSN